MIENLLHILFVYIYNIGIYTVLVEYERKLPLMVGEIPPPTIFPNKETGD